MSWLKRNMPITWLALRHRRVLKAQLVWLVAAEKLRIASRNYETACAAMARADVQYQAARHEMRESGENHADR